MKSFLELTREQATEVKYLRSLIDTVVQRSILPNKKILGALLTGSVSRGDARVGPFGLFIDFAIIVRNRNEVDLTALLGPDEKPDLPFHCVTLDGNIGLAVELVEYMELLNIRNKDEASIFAKDESTILFDKEGLLKSWKAKYFTITEDDIRKRALVRLFRVGYLIGEYRMEKWERREAWAQLNQNMNEACECFCEFLYCINGSFVPRKDWLVYLTYEQEKKPANLESLMEHLYQSASDKDSVRKRRIAVLSAYEWMSSYSKMKGWI
jgi:hypothetical protein